MGFEIQNERLNNRTLHAVNVIANDPATSVSDSWNLTLIYEEIEKNKKTLEKRMQDIRVKYAKKDDDGNPIKQSIKIPDSDKEVQVYDLNGNEDTAQKEMDELLESTTKINYDQIKVKLSDIEKFNKDKEEDKKSTIKGPLLATAKPAVVVQP